MGLTSDISAVRSTIEKYVTGSGTGDADLLRSIFHKDAVMMGAMGDEFMEGTPEPFFKMVEDSPALLSSDANYRAEIVDIQVFGKAAIATLVEDGFFGMSFVDCFHLLNTEGSGWVITSKVFNRD
ncbi:MAG: nuclear transport factor 2 family protein [Gammaproteobacteria bacterium]|nr:nuclear transport factor 2 family protein [Gammaproteobacteria bacterium]